MQMDLITGNLPVKRSQNGLNKVTSGKSQEPAMGYKVQRQ